MKSWSLLFAVCLSALASAMGGRSCRGSMQYKVRFQGMWSSARHPVDYPSNAHFSPVVIVSHIPDISVFSVGTDASSPVQVVAETGNPMPLRKFLQEAQVAGAVGDVTHAAGPFDSTDFVMLDITVDREHDVVSLISMLAPSPDWFTGVNSYSLCDNGRWITEAELMDLMVYDAGTDSGAQFLSNDVATDPKEPIRLLECGEGVFCSEGDEFLPVASVKFMLAGDECRGSQLYKVSFTGLWNRRDHPVDYPSNAMFSPPVFATHTRGYSFAKTGFTVTPGVQKVAEEGATMMLLGELDSVHKMGLVGDYETGPMGMVEADSAHSLFSAVSMLFPSPDWIVSGSAQLCNPATRKWKKTVELPALTAYDVGTDSGETFLSENSPVDPPSPIKSFGCGRVFCNPGETLAPLAKVVLEAVSERDFVPCRGSRKYMVDVEGMWSASSHPVAYPEDAHFSPLNVVAHSGAVSLFQRGEPVTKGVQMVAETGNPMVLRDELFGARIQRKVADIGLSTGPFTDQSSTVEITVDPANPYISVISMLAPSPDWFFSYTINMCERGRWMRRERSDIRVVYDAGTDMGESFLSENSPNETPEGVTSIPCGKVFCKEGDELEPIARVNIRS